MGIVSRRISALLLGITLCTVAHGDHYTAIGQWEKPFTSLESMREQGHTVHVLYTNSTDLLVAQINKAIPEKQGRTDQELDDLLGALNPLIDEELVKKSATADFAVRKLAKKLKLKRFPAVITQRADKLYAVYGLTDLQAAASELDKEVQ